MILLEADNSKEAQASIRIRRMRRLEPPKGY
jgi:hypothetical protein